jgi:hypothetical protein
MALSLIRHRQRSRLVDIKKCRDSEVVDLGTLRDFHILSPPSPLRERESYFWNVVSLYVTLTGTRATGRISAMFDTLQSARHSQCSGKADASEVKNARSFAYALVTILSMFGNTLNCFLRVNFQFNLLYVYIYYIKVSKALPVTGRGGL